MVEESRMWSFFINIKAKEEFEPSFMLVLNCLISIVRKVLVFEYIAVKLYCFHNVTRQHNLMFGLLFSWDLIFLKYINLHWIYVLCKCSTFLNWHCWLCVLTYFEHDSWKFVNGFDYFIEFWTLQWAKFDGKFKSTCFSTLLQFDFPFQMQMKAEIF